MFQINLCMEIPFRYSMDRENQPVNRAQGNMAQCESEYYTGTYAENSGLNQERNQRRVRSSFCWG